MHKNLGSTQKNMKPNRGSDHDSAGASRNSKQKKTPSITDKDDQQLNDLDMSVMDHGDSDSERSDDLSKESLDKFESRQSID